MNINNNHSNYNKLNFELETTNNRINKIDSNTFTSNENEIITTFENAYKLLIGENYMVGFLRNEEVSNPRDKTKLPTIYSCQEVLKNVFQSSSEEDEETIFKNVKEQYSPVAYNKKDPADFLAEDEYVDNLNKTGFKCTDDNGNTVTVPPGTGRGRAWSPDQLLAINQAAKNAFSALDQLYKEQQRRLEEQDKEDERSQLSNRNISAFKNDKSFAKSGNLTYQVYLKLQNEIAKRMTQELIATEQANQARRKEKRKREEKDRKFDDLQSDIRVAEQKNFDKKLENIKFEKDIKISEKSPQKIKQKRSKL